MKAGTFTRDKEGTIYGKIQALGLGNLDVVFESRLSKKNEVFYKIVADPNGTPFEIGTAWPKVKDKLHYFSVSLDTVFSTTPINAALFPGKTNPNILNLVWNKKPEPNAKPEATKEDEGQRPKVETVHKPKEPRNKGVFGRSASLDV